MTTGDKKESLKQLETNNTLLTGETISNDCKILIRIMKGRIKWDNLRCWGNKNNNPVSLEVLNPAKIPS